MMCFFLKQMECGHVLGKGTLAVGDSDSPYFPRAPVVPSEKVGLGARCQEGLDVIASEAPGALGHVRDDPK